MSNEMNNPMRYSKYIKTFSYYAKTSSDIDWINNINKELEKHDIEVIMPIFETGIRTLIKHKTKISQQDRLGLLPSLSNFDTALNKGLLAKHLDANNLPNPKTVSLSTELEFDNVNSLNFPVIIKPEEGFGGGQGIIKFNSKEELHHYFSNHDFEYINIVQEYIEGYDIDCSVLCKSGEILAFTIQKGNMTGKNQFSPQFGLSFLYEDELYRVVEKLMKSLKWNGVAHIDMRYDRKANLFKVIEVNARFWVSLDASLIAGVNFPYLYCLASKGHIFKIPQYSYISYINLKGVVKSIKKNITFIFKVNFILKHTPLQFALKDPLPMIYKFISRTRNILRSRLPK
ncbi:ATP-grasp enzyme-like protein [Winogradskyella sp. PG-2]|nr:ATP-grasp enzyme-like protein [Winogradskyella sp. PG-2]